MESIQQFKQAVFADDGAGIAELLARDPEVKAKLDAPLFYFDSPAIVIAASQGKRHAIDALLAAGANINARSSWWAGSFGVLDNASPEISAYLIERGARVDAHAASRLGMIEKLKELIGADSALVHARGGDGKMPLHFAATVKIAEYLLEHGADIDARDIDHESTAAQYLVAEHPEVARYLVSRGAQADILLATALGDLERVRKIMDADPAAIQMRVNAHFFPMQNPKAGGSIYIWTLGNNRTAHQVARKFGHDDVLQFLMDRSSDEVKLLNACLVGDAATAKALLAGHPDLAATLSDADRGQISAAAQDNDTEAVRLMLDCGWPVDGCGGATPLHFAAWHGNFEMVRVILPHNPSLELANSATFNSTPFGWAIHGSENGWHKDTGDYGAVVTALLAAGAKPPAKIEGSPAVRSALESATRSPKP